MTYFFRERKLLHELDFNLNDKTQIKGKVYEKWVQKIGRSVACGAEEKRVIKRELGIEKTQREDLESLVKGSIGIKGIASMEAQITAKIGTEVTLKHLTSVEEEKRFAAPECGRITICVYQLVREYDLTITNNSSFSFSKKPKTIQITEHTDNFYDETVRTDSDLDCGCKKTDEPEDDGLLSLMIKDNYQLVAVYKQMPEGVLLKSINLFLSVSDLGKMVLGKHTINASVLPKHILFFSGIKEETVPLELNTNSNLVFSFDEWRIANDLIINNLVSSTTLQGSHIPNVYGTTIEHLTAGTITSYDAASGTGNLTDKKSNKVIRFYQPFASELGYKIGDNVRYALIKSLKGEELAVNLTEVGEENPTIRVTRRFGSLGEQGEK